MSLDRTAIPRNVLDRLLEVERRLDDLEGFAALSVVDPESGEGDTTYVSIVQEVEIGEGPGIDVTGASPEQTVGLGGDTVLLYDAGGDPVAEFAATSAGLIAALAAMADGDVCELPAGTISGGPWTVTHGTLRGKSLATVLDGQVNVSDNCRLEGASVIRSGSDTDPVIGVQLADGGEVTRCVIIVANVAGPAYAVYAQHDGECEAHDCVVGATGNSSNGYGYYADGAEIYANGGLVTEGTIPVGVV